MKNLFQNTAFILGFWGGISLFVFLNYISYMASYSKYDKGRMVMSGGGYYIGFPFKAHYTYIGYPSGTEILWIGLVADILITLTCCFVIGLILKSVWARINIYRFR